MVPESSEAQAQPCQSYHRGNEKRESSAYLHLSHTGELSVSSGQSSPPLRLNTIGGKNTSTRRTQRMGGQLAQPAEHVCAIPFSSISPIGRRITEDSDPDPPQLWSGLALCQH